MNAIQRFKEWVNFEIEYTQTKVEKPNKERVGKYLIFGGLISAVLGFVGYILSPYKTELYESVTYSRYPPYSTITGVIILLGIISIIISLFFLGSEQYFNKKEV